MRTTDTVCPICKEVGDHLQLDTREGDTFFMYACPHCGGIHDLEAELRFWFAWETEVSPSGETINVVRPVQEGVTYYVSNLFHTEEEALAAIAAWEAGLTS
jgi:hypothetical protein